MDYIEALKYLENIELQGVKLGLERITTIIQNLPFDVREVNFIQVAGTNGKGSTSHFIASILDAAGYKTGLFTSPHLEDIRERISISNRWIGKESFAENVANVKKLCDKLLSKKIIDAVPTYFEYMLLVALVYFYNKRVDYAILEVGLGGRLDATTAITPVISVITKISLEHTLILGNRIKDIAFEKAGIIKKGVPVICGCSVHSNSSRVIGAVASRRNAPFHPVQNSQNRLTVDEKTNHYHCRYQTRYGSYQFDVYLNGEHQTQNAATAVKALEVLHQRLGQTLQPEAIIKGIKTCKVPGRIENIQSGPGILLDSGHNLDGIKVLEKYLRKRKLHDLTMIFGVLKDKKYKSMVSILRPYVTNVILTEPLSSRALPAKKLKAAFKDIHTVIQPNLHEALKMALKLGQRILITGSFYLAGEMRKIILRGN